MSTLGNEFIDDKVSGLIPKVAASAALGGSVEEIGGGKFANGAITVAYGMMFNDMLHNEGNPQGKKGGVSNISASGIDFIAGYEHFSESIYIDPCGNPTIGYGHLIRPGENYTTINTQEATQLLSNDVEKAVNVVNKYVKVPLSQNQFDAMTSFTFNVGVGNLLKSSLLRNVNSGDNSVINASFLKWNKGLIKGKYTTLPGLTGRRQAESNLFLK